MRTCSAALPSTTDHSQYCWWRLLWAGADALHVDGDQSLAPVRDNKKPTQTNPSDFVVRDVGPQLDCLWTYQSSTTKGRNVSCIGWNFTNPVCTSHKLLRASNDCSVLTHLWSSHVAHLLIILFIRHRQRTKTNHTRKAKFKKCQVVYAVLSCRCA